MQSKLSGCAMPLPITPENFAAVLIAGGTGASAVLTAIGGMALWRKRKEPPPPGSPDALTVSMVENTKAMGQMNGAFSENLRMFSAILELVKVMATDMSETRRSMHNAEQHLAAIRDATNRRAR